MSTSTMNGAVWKSGTLINGNAVIIPMADAPYGCSPYTIPVAGDTVTVSYSNDGGTNYITKTTATSAWTDTLVGAITHIKFQRTAGAGTTSTYGITQ